MKKPDKDVARVTVKMSKPAKRCLFEMAKSHDMSVSQYIRSSIF